MIALITMEADNDGSSSGNPVADSAVAIHFSEMHVTLHKDNMKIIARNGN